LKRHDTFSALHPAVSCLYFGMVICFAILLMHPLCLLISLAGALIYALRLKGGRAMRQNLRILIPMLLLTALLNPAFSHQGATVLAYLPTGNPLTLESVLYGIAAAAMLGGVFGWFACFHEVMTTDKLVYLFGRILPAISLLLSMTLRFVPRFAAQAKAVAQAQRGLTPETERSAAQRMRSGIRILSALVTWSMESAVETADSMRSRGYGLPGRTAFALYRFDRRDGAALAGMLVCGGAVLAGKISGALRWNWYPAAGGGRFGIWQGIGLLAYLTLCLLPVLMDARADLLWKREGRTRSVR
jgi:energy-coupling factor transport system permease protein